MLFNTFIGLQTPMRKSQFLAATPLKFFIFSLSPAIDFYILFITPIQFLFFTPISVLNNTDPPEGLDSTRVAGTF